MAQYEDVLGLPKYSLAASLAPGKRVLIISPGLAEGAALLVEAGAREVLAVGATSVMPAGVQAREDGLPRLPLHDRSIDLIVVDGRASDLGEAVFMTVIEEAFRVLSPEGHAIFDVQMEGAKLFGVVQERAPGVDFWGLEAALTDRASSVQLFAQLSWQGFALSPVLEDDEERALAVEVDESALIADVDPARYVMVAGAVPLPREASELCLLVALPDAVLEEHRPPPSVPPEVADELSRLRDALGVRAAKSAALQRTVRELEAQLTALRVRPAAEDPGKVRQLTETIEAQRLQLEGSHEKLEQLVQEQAITQKSMTALRVFSERTAQELARVTDECAVLQTEGEQSNRSLEQARERHDDLSYELERARTELDVLEQVARDQERALKSASSRERERRSDWEEARAEVVSLRASMEHLREERDELRREYDELVAIHQRVEHDLQRTREELRVTSRRTQDRAREYEARIEELEHLRSRLDEVQRQLSQLEEENFRLRTSQTSAREVARAGHVTEELSRDRDRLRLRLTQRGEELHELERAALSHRMEAARMELELERARREQDRLRTEVARARGIDGPALADGDASGDETGKDGEGSDLDRVEEELSQARNEVTTLRADVAELQRDNARLESENRRRADREEVLAGMLEGGGTARNSGDSSEDVSDSEGPERLGDDGMPERWPEEARRRIRRLERRLKFGGDGGAAEFGGRIDPALEARVRAAEQAHLIGRLEAAEQVIWEMSDTADRHAARHEASVTELRREREMRQAAIDELEVLRRLLGVERDRSLERERLLSDARASLATHRGTGAPGDAGSVDGSPGDRMGDLVDLEAHDAGEREGDVATLPPGEA